MVMVVMSIREHHSAGCCLMVMHIRHEQSLQQRLHGKITATGLRVASQYSMNELGTLCLDAVSEDDHQSQGVVHN